jgi:cell division protein FtsI/penicillin-binding protein 2
VRGGAGWGRAGAGCVRRRVAGVATGVLLVATGVAACGSSTPSAAPTVTAFLAAWDRQAYPAMAALVRRPPADFRAANAAVVSDLDVTASRYRAGAVIRHGSRATVPVTSTLTLAVGVHLTLHSTLALRLAQGRWLIDWTSRTISAALAPADHLALSVTWPTRAQVLGAGGASLIPDATMVTVGLAGYRITDAATLQTALLAAGLDATSVTAALAAAKAHPKQFEPIQTLSNAAYQAIKAQIYSLPGTQFETTQVPTPLTAALGAQVVGSLGPATAQELKSLGAPYTVGDVVGQGGLEGQDERQLAGSPAIRVTVVGAGAKTLHTLFSRPATPGRDVQTSIDPTVQMAAETSLAGVTKPAAVVVMRASTGQVLASVSLPTDGFDLALGATVPPGSTFKVVTSTALLAAGDTVSTPATCPPTVDIDGKSFHNDEGESASTLSFAQAFAQSCNTAFIGLSAGLSDAALPAAAKLFGIGVTPQMGLPAYGGKVPTPTDAVDLAATAIGQGEVTVSPLDMATVAAAVDSGSLHEPRLVAGAPDDSVAPTALDPAVVSALHTLMAGVVATGTAAGEGLPVGTYGKTGTAEYGSGANPPTHAWFIGFDGDIAFAVFVYGGGTGGTVAAPIATKLLTALGPAA